jgi:diacylglycerol kinase family enzyme
MLRDFDVGCAIGPWGRSMFLEAIGTGAFAEAVAALEGDEPGKKRKKKDKLKEARRGFSRILREAKPIRAGIAVDGEELPDDVLLVEVMNITQMGPRLQLARGADSADGCLDVVCLPKERRDEMLDWLESADGDAPAPVSTARARRVSIDWNGTPLRVGDEVASGKSRGHVNVELESESLQVLVPAENERDISQATEG